MPRNDKTRKTFKEKVKKTGNHESFIRETKRSRGKEERIKCRTHLKKRRRNREKCGNRHGVRRALASRKPCLCSQSWSLDSPKEHVPSNEVSSKGRGPESTVPFILRWIQRAGLTGLACCNGLQWSLTPRETTYQNYWVGKIPHPEHFLHLQ